MAKAALKVELEEVNFEEVFEEAKKRFLKEVKWKENASCLFIQHDGLFGGVYNHVCHANLRSGNGSKFIVNGLQDGTNYGNNPGRVLSPQVELWFVDYILNRSPYSQIFVTKDAEKAIAERIVIASGDHPGNLVGAGLVALRRLWEYVFVAGTAYDLSQAGVNEDLAFYLGHIIQVENVPDRDSIASWTASTAGHCSLDPCRMGFKELENFLDHKVKKPNPNYSDHGSYAKYDWMYGECDYGYSVAKYIWDKFPVDKYKEMVVVNTNPFQASKIAVAGKADNSQAPYHKAIEVMVEWSAHLMEKINNA